MDINVSLSSGKKIFPGEVIHKIWKKKKRKKMMKICTKRFYILHLRVIIFYTRYKFSLKLSFTRSSEFVRFVTRLSWQSLLCTNFISFVKKISECRILIKKKLSCILWTRKPIWRWMEKREKRKKSKKIKRRARTAFSFFSKSIKKKKKKNVVKTYT